MQIHTHTGTYIGTLIGTHTVTHTGTHTGTLGRLISLHCAVFSTACSVFQFLHFTCRALPFPLSLSLSLCLLSLSLAIRQTFYFVIFLPQAAANATQIKHATFCCPYSLLSFAARPCDFLPFVAWQTAQLFARIALTFFGDPHWALGLGLSSHPVIKHPLISCFYLHIHAAHSQLNWQPACQCLDTFLQPAQQQQQQQLKAARIHSAANRIINIQRALLCLRRFKFSHPAAFLGAIKHIS